jgi:hypothetical protein
VIVLEDPLWHSGRVPSDSLVYVTTGLLKAMDDEELLVILAELLTQLQSELLGEKYD